jgi:hypothetical protein
MWWTLSIERVADEEGGHNLSSFVLLLIEVKLSFE